MPKRELPSLRDEMWLRETRLQDVLRVLNESGETRVAGGAVRNSLLGEPVADIDLATTLLPDDVMRVGQGSRLWRAPHGHRPWHGDSDAQGSGL